MSEEKIKAFLQKMVTQDNRATAFPFYYVIRTEVEDMAPVDNCDHTKWYWSGTESSYDSLEDLEKDLKAGVRARENRRGEARGTGVRRPQTMGEARYVSNRDGFEHFKIERTPK